MRDYFVLKALIRGIGTLVEGHSYRFSHGDFPVESSYLPKLFPMRLGA